MDKMPRELRLAGKEEGEEAMPREAYSLHSTHPDLYCFTPGQGSVISSLHFSHSLSSQLPTSTLHIAVRVIFF